MSLRRPLAFAATALVALPASAAAEQTTDLRYQCKYPLVGIKMLDAQLQLDLADRTPTSVPIGPSALRVQASAFDMAAGLQAIDDLTAIRGTSTAYATVKTEQGFNVPAKTVGTVPFTMLPDPIPDPLVWVSDGQLPALVFDDPGVEEVRLDRLSFNLTAIDSVGDPIALPPITRDLDGSKVSPSDDDPFTFDVYCRLAPSDQDPGIGRFVVGDGPVPSITPRPTLPPLPTATPVPTPDPNATPTPTPGPTPPPTPTPVPGADTTPPSVPGESFGAPASDIGADSLLVRWSASQDEPDGSGLDHYVVSYEDQSFTVGPNETTFKLTGLSPNSDYDVFIYAVDGAGNVSLPLYLAFTTLPGPTPVPTPTPVGWTPSPIPTATPIPTPTPIPTATPLPTATPGPGQQKLTATYLCKYPLVGIKRLTLDSTIDMPNTWPTSVPTSPFAVRQEFRLFDMAAGLQAIAGLSSLQGTTTAFATVKTAQGFNVPAKTVSTIPSVAISSTVPDPLVLTSLGQTPALTFDDPGVEELFLDKLAINLTAKDAAGDPIPLPPVTKDIDGNKVSDSDGDGNTFDVYCKLDPANQGTKWGSFEILGNPAPTPVGTPAPTLAPTPTPTPKPATPTPAPTVVPTPYPGADTTSPSSPTETFDGVESDITPTSIIVRWGAAQDDPGGSGIDHYVVTYEDQSFIAPATARSYKLDGLGPEADFDVFVYAVDKAGNVSLPLYLNYRTLYEGTPTPAPTLAPTPSPKPVTPTPKPATPTATPTPASAKYAYALTGSTTLNTLTKGTMPLSGSVNATLALATGDIVADLTLNDTQGRVIALGFLPVTVNVRFVTSGQTTGKVVDDQLTTNSKVRIKVGGVKAFGAIPLVSGNSCQTKQLSDITLKSTGPFDPIGTGGTLAGTYAISDLNGCGPLNGLVSPVTAGTGNTIAVKLTPKPGA
ncbi:MAG: fibronectin type III domain-containing protein [Solirubrobacteraceae bacterium]|nr:fibronectin type III domain-containing protein [Solirubrobacteraceae bacterium]